jgi:hypothetical protein
MYIHKYDLQIHHEEGSTAIQYEAIRQMHDAHANPTQEQKSDRMSAE